MCHSGYFLDPLDNFPRSIDTGSSKMVHRTLVLLIFRRTSTTLTIRKLVFINVYNKDRLRAITSSPLLSSVRFSVPSRRTWIYIYIYTLCYSSFSRLGFVLEIVLFSLASAHRRIHSYAIIKNTIFIVGKKDRTNHSPLHPSLFPLFLSYNSYPCSRFHP